ncbi:MAG: hypothetical protein WA947_01975 [Phormidesmis sp.]
MRKRKLCDEASILMSIGELNQLMTYVTDGWMLFSVGFIGFEFISFVSRRIQEDIEADAVALASQQSVEASEIETAKVSVADVEDVEAEDLLVKDAARLKEVAAVSEQLAKTKSKQPDAPSVSVSTER